MPTPGLPRLDLPRRTPEEFAAELRALIARHPTDPTLARALRYGEPPAPFLHLSATLARKAGFYHTGAMLDLDPGSARAVGIDGGGPERHHPWAATLGAAESG